MRQILTAQLPQRRSYRPRAVRATTPWPCRTRRHHACTKSMPSLFTCYIVTARSTTVCSAHSEIDCVSAVVAVRDTESKQSSGTLNQTDQCKLAHVDATNFPSLPWLRAGPRCTRGRAAVDGEGEARDRMPGRERLKQCRRHDRHTASRRVAQSAPGRRLARDRGSRRADREQGAQDGVDCHLRPTAGGSRGARGQGTAVRLRVPTRGGWQPGADRRRPRHVRRP